MKGENMNFETMREWLARKLKHADDTMAAAGGTSLEALQQDARSRIVTPAALAEVPTEIGKVVRYVREQRGWTRGDLAELADIDEIEISLIETLEGQDLSPRSLVNVANVCGFSVTRFQQLAKHVEVRSHYAADKGLRFAARSKNVGAVTQEELDAISALVATLSDKALDDR
ncbi:helix-turn-helix domain-containing protein [Lysobacter solisilvae (ex Woo and Kim 2020)]|uniref:Helix-turn-helix transcriptional regulator n=1 Tax=Agrilutibacter terrestris TaxID=2865112 RepID=A0A7H0G0A9_9GAMM|nr:helix-turn-helix domain-containing protein [Lysobacter terrestris]QNP41725.1 helix-turn-helix transcriptional regulator [Lysobacter terrestris]